LLLLLVFPALVQGETIKLIAEASYTNESNKDVYSIQHRITIPEERYYQKVTQINVYPESKYKIKNHNKLELQYIKLDFGNLKRGETKSKQVEFIIELSNLDTDFRAFIEKSKDHTKFLKASKRVESNSKQLKSITYLIDHSEKKFSDKIKLAFEFPARFLKYRVLQRSTSALTAIKEGYGDCTEYAFLFVSLARNLGLPARKVSAFNFSKNNEFKVPNHDIAEIYLDNYGWMPVYPNLSQGRDKGKYALGKISDTLLIYKHRKWTWSRSFKNRLDKSFSKKVKTKMSWKVEKL